jgi:hypothetical protein
MIQPVPVSLLPQYSLAVQETDSGDEIMMLIIGTPSTTHQFYLSDSEGYVEVARKIHDGIITTGKQMKKKSRIIPANGSLPDGLSNPQRRK